MELCLAFLPGLRPSVTHHLSIYLVPRFFPTLDHYAELAPVPTGSSKEIRPVKHVRIYNSLSPGILQSTRASHFLTEGCAVLAICPTR